MVHRFACSRVYSSAARVRRQGDYHLYRLCTAGLVLLERARSLQLISNDEFRQFRTRLTRQRRLLHRRFTRFTTLPALNHAIGMAAYSYAVLINEVRAFLRAREHRLPSLERLERAREMIVAELQTLRETGTLTGLDYDALMATADSYYQTFRQSLQDECSAPETTPEMVKRFVDACAATLMALVYRARTQTSPIPCMPRTCPSAATIPPCHPDGLLQVRIRSRAPRQSVVIGVL